MAEECKLSSSMEDYLEAIFHIVSEKQAARAKDIAKRLEVNNSSVTGALRSLSEKGLINYAPYDLITLTETGKAAAQNVVRRHKALKDFFIKILCAAEKEAEDTACKMEHAISRTSLSGSFSSWILWNPAPSAARSGSPDLRNSVTRERKRRDCEGCISDTLEKFRDTQK